MQASTLSAWRSDSDDLDVVRYLEGVIVPLLQQKQAKKRANIAGGTGSSELSQGDTSIDVAGLRLSADNTD